VSEANARQPVRPRGWALHWNRLERSLGRRWREWRLPAGYIRLGTKYGGWWFDRKLVRADPLVVDCGLGQDISFDAAFLSRFGGTVIGIDPNPESLAWCRAHCPPGMQVLDRAFWTSPGQTLAFHLPRPREQLPGGADGVSGSLISSHAYVAGGASLPVTTVDLAQVLADAGRSDCDILKLDIEGAEYEVLPDLARRGLLAKCRQLLVEFHHGATGYGRAQTEEVVAAVLAASFRLAHVEGRNYIFRRDDLA
jgi:FkbM family methyltransferase